MAPSTRSRRSQSLKQTTLTTMLSPAREQPPPRQSARRQEHQRFQSDDGSSGLDDVRMLPPSSPAKSSPKAGSVSCSTRKKRRVQVVESEDEGGSDDADTPAVEYQSRSSPIKPTNNNNRSEAISDSGSPPPRRVLTRGKRLRHSSSSRSSEADLADEVDADRIVESRFRERDKKTAFQRNLDKLKRRKQGKSSVDSVSSDDEEDEESEEEKPRPFRGARPMIIDADDQEEAEADSDHSSEFIVEDNDAAPIELPPEFSMNSHQDLPVQFKTIFQFFVHIAVQEAPERHGFMAQCMREQSYFATPLRTMRKKLSGIRDSLVASSVWRSSFRRALEKYPNFDLLDLGFTVPRCDACQLGGRLSSRLGRLSGSPYDKYGFVSEDSSDSDEEQDDDDDVTEFNLGRFCAQRTRVFHEFTHWEHILFKSIEEEVEQLRARQDATYTRTAGGILPPDDLTDADAICDWLDRRKVIDLEWSRVKEMMDSGGKLDAAMKKGMLEDD
ncbi:hypothetical protein BDN72DRAFT_830988 [Pluteus cervinus]|uniref:Uncharacterized protein n=1 Tax=Pluteus cervinus TaxID=181527 RepID=A0ACD3BEF3_9AGAR|nr:hypothetical protein BDN72DRAFT_830988 [Pluteus cervinus]